MISFLLSETDKYVIILLSPNISMNIWLELQIAEPIPQKNSNIAICEYPLAQHQNI